MKKPATTLMLTAMASAILVFSSCQKEGCTDPDALNYNPEATKDCCCEYKSVGVLKFKVKEKSGNEAFQLDKVFDIEGVPTKLTHTGFYFSNFTLLSDTGEVPVPNSYVLYNSIDGGFTVTGVPTGSFNGIKLCLGIDSATNYTTLPADYLPGEPLSSQKPIMHWSWNTGYIFLRFDGQVDTSQPADNTMDEALTFHIGTHPFLTTIEFSKNITIADGQTSELGITIDYAKFFEGIDLRETHVTHTGDFKDLADKFRPNMAKPFSLQ